MGREEIYVTGIGDVRIDGDCVRAELVSGEEKIVLRGSINTSLAAIEGLRRAVAERSCAEVIPLPSAKKRNGTGRPRRIRV